MENDKSMDGLFNSLFGGEGAFSRYNFGTFFPGASGNTDEDKEKVMKKNKNNEGERDWRSAYLSMKDDFDSYRKRIDCSREAERKNLTKEIICGFLDVVDFAVFTFKAKNRIGTYSKEDEMILDRLSTFLEAYDVHPMKDPVGSPFDHNYHEAVLSDKSGMFKSGIVTLCVAHGYMIGDEVLRYAKVAVAE